LHPGEQHAGRGLNARGELQDRVEPWKPRPALDGADFDAMQFDSFGQRRLAQASMLSAGPKR
jgi:hypothetical protein